MMELNELIKKIGGMRDAMTGRLDETSAEQMKTYVQGFSDALDAVTATVKKAIERQRTLQRLARLDDELAQEMEPELPTLPGTLVNDAMSARQASNRDSGREIDSL